MITELKDVARKSRGIYIEDFESIKSLEDLWEKFD